MKRACVIGWPISHSRSPLVHGYWLKQYGIDGSYTREAVEPQQLAEFLSSLGERGFAGCNVTIPHKEEAFHLVEPDDDLTRRLEVVNTLFFRDGRLHGVSSDGPGYLAHLQQSVPAFAASQTPVLLLGAGGAAQAIAAALLAAGAPRVFVSNRTVERAEAMAKKFGAKMQAVEWNRRNEAMTDVGLVINTTALGMAGQPALNVDLARLPATAIVSDIVYTPLETPLLAAARQRGLTAVDGLGMLLHQAVSGFEKWFGVRPSVTPELYELVAADIRKAAKS